MKKDNVNSGGDMVWDEELRMMIPACVSVGEASVDDEPETVEIPTRKVKKEVPKKTTDASELRIKNFPRPVWRVVKTIAAHEGKNTREEMIEICTLGIEAKVKKLRKIEDFLSYK